MPRKSTALPIDKTDWTWQVVRRCRNELGIAVREDFIGIPVNRERATEIMTYKNLNENRTGVTYFIKDVAPKSKN